tara:strand:+ start:1103 stop:2353 length:1251 start_codon:yes stop_codon:yes gene_type:complete
MQIKQKMPRLRFSEFNSSWERLSISEFLIDYVGGAPLKPEDFVAQGEYEVIPKKAIVPFGKMKLDDNGTFCSESFFTSYYKNTIDKSYLVTTLRDLVPSGPNIGYIVEFESSKRFMLAQGVYGFKLDETKINRGFLIQFSNTWPYRKVMRRIMVGSTQVHIRNEDFFATEVPVPPVEEQKKVAEFLSTVDKKISLLKEKHALLEQYKKGVMQKLFKQEIRFKDDSGSDFPNWQEKTMGQVLTPEIREINKPSEKYLALGVRSHMKGTFQKPDSDPDAIAMEKLYIVRPNDLIVNITFAWEGAIAIAKPEDNGGLVSHRFPTYTFKSDQATHRFFRHIIQLKRFKHMLDLISPGGAGRNRVLSKSEFLKLKWILPSVREQEKIAGFLDVIDVKLSLLNEQIELTQTFKKGLLQQMFV